MLIPLLLLVLQSAACAYAAKEGWSRRLGLYVRAYPHGSGGGGGGGGGGSSSGSGSGAGELGFRVGKLLLQETMQQQQQQQQQRATTVDATAAAAAQQQQRLLTLHIVDERVAGPTLEALRPINLPLGDMLQVRMPLLALPSGAPALPLGARTPLLPSCRRCSGWRLPRSSSGARRSRPPSTTSSW